MTPRTVTLGLSTLLLALGVTMNANQIAAKSDEYDPKIDPAEFQATIDNPYLPLIPGTTYMLQEKRGKHVSQNEVTVTRDHKTIMGVPCVVVHDVVREKGKLKEDTFDWYAQDKEGNVWYFGEDTKEYHGKNFSTKGSWEAGIGGNKPGIIMPAHPAPGKPYTQEYSPGNAMDMGQVVAVGEKTTVPAGTYNDCVRTKEWSLLEAGSEKKWYARGVGVVREESTDFEVCTLMSVAKP
jgi:hypothetical protein